MQKKKDSAYLKGLVNKSIKKYVVMTIIGCVILTIGGILLGVGIGLIASTPQGRDPSAGGLALYIIGLILLIGPGDALATVGTICWIAMGVQIKVARNKLGITKTNNKISN